MVRPVIAAACALILAAPAAGQQRIANATLISRPAGASVAQTVRTIVASAADATWIAYAVPVVDGERVMCCFNSGNTWINGDVVTSDDGHCCGQCRLEPSAEGTSMSTRPQGQGAAGVVKLEGADTMLVLLRVFERRIERVRVFSEDCQLDAGGRPVTWLEGVRPADSIAMLESLVADNPERRNRVTDGAVSAIALHGDAAADAALERLLAAGQPAHVREKVPFWLGNSRGARGLELLRRVVADDASTELRKKAIFGISQSREPGATDTLIDAARNNSTPAIRAEAIFWLGQKAGTKAAGAITDLIERDPDTDVKKRAVFALSQLPKDEGVPLLIKVARSHTNPAVRKQAIFWLGQSKDPRAIDFFAEILK